MSLKSFVIGMFVGIIMVLMVVVGFRCQDEIKEAAVKTWAAVRPLLTKSWIQLTNLFKSLRTEKPQLGDNTTPSGETVVQV